jgi:tripartite-type tricarboxylate transporter receptor subunit TctC
VENRAGAGGQIGTEIVASSAPDGYTMLFASSSTLTLPYLRKTRFELLRDFVPVGQVGIGGFVLVVSPKLPFRTLAEFLSAAKANPGKYTFGSPGVGSAGHLALHLLKAKSGIEMVHVPFKSSTEVAQALIGGQIDCAIDIVPIQKPYIEAQNVRALATTGAARDANLPSLPTFNESGLVPEGYEITFWYGMFLPRATPAPVVQRVQREFATVMKDPEVVQRVRAFSLEPSNLSAQGFAANIAADTTLWRKVIEDNKIVVND